MNKGLSEQMCWIPLDSKASSRAEPRDVFDQSLSIRTRAVVLSNVSDGMSSMTMMEVENVVDIWVRR